MTRVGDLTEDQLLALIGALLPTGALTCVGPGDDAAVVLTPDGRMVVTCDVLVEDLHFRRAWSSGEDVGARAAVQNLADIAAMGAAPSALVVALVLPGDLPVEFVQGFARGMAGVCEPLGVGVVGGDLSAGPLVVASVTAHGNLEGRAPVLRSGARAGDTLAHAGVAGWSAAGLALLGAGRGELDPELVRAYLRPASPLAAGPAAARAGATAMLDVSDGLVRDATRIAVASGVRIDLDLPATAFTGDLERLAGAAQALDLDPADWVLGGGEDHGLLATFPPGAQVPAPFRAIGRVRVTDGVPVVVGGLPPATSTAGWDHFAGQPRR